MLWSLLKILFFVVLVAAAAMGAGMLMETGTGVRLAIGNIEFNMGPLHAVIFAAVLIFAVWALIKLAGLLVAVVKFLMGDETAISRYFSRNRERKGFKAIAESLTALASGEGREALSKAARAERYLNRPELTNLLMAQAAEMAGDRKKAQDVYKRLLQDDKTRFVGVRGIMKQRLAEGDTDTALKLAEKAHDLKPAHEEVQDILLQLQADHADWTGARKTLNSKLKTGVLPRDIHRRRDATLALSEACDILAEGKTVEAREAAIEAHRLSPDLIPAAAMAARSYIEQGKSRYATRILKKAWSVQPHPDLASAFADIKPDETPEARIKRFRALTTIAPNDPETRMLKAELRIAAEDFPAARQALGDLPETHPTARSLTLMAAIERGEGSDDSVVRGWLTKALTASRGPQWICDNCGTVHAQWAPVCQNCSGFDTLSWKEATTGEISMPRSTEMLPLIVGAIEDKSDETIVEAEDVVEAEEVAEEVSETAEEASEVAEAEIIELVPEEKKEAS